MLLSVLTAHPLSALRYIRAEEEVVEQIFRSHVAHVVVMASSTMASAGFSLLKALGAAHLVILSSFLRIAETRHRSINLFERFSGFGMRVFVWMHLDGSFFEALFNVVLCGCLRNSQDSVVVLA